MVSGASVGTGAEAKWAGWPMGQTAGSVGAMPDPAVTALTDRFVRAVDYVRVLHGHQIRKATQIPYLAHLLSVSALVLENGGDEECAIAGLLHDAVEDAGGKPRLAAIRAEWGDRVADIVVGCTDSDTYPKPPWRPRKEAYIAHLASASPDVLLVSAADKVHNSRTIVADYRQIGDALWSRFDAGSDQAWYYNALLAAFRARGADAPKLLVDELAATLAELETLMAPGRL